MAELGFDLEAAVSLSELRGEEWPNRLEHFGKLRVERRGEVVGVLLSRQQWQAVAETIRELEQRLETAEDEIVRTIIDRRSDAKLKRGPSLRAGVEERLARRRR
jgi:diphthamide synthase subunit DPH2